MIKVLKAYSNVFSFVHKNKIWSFYWLPIIFNLSLLILLYWFLSFNVESLVSWVSLLFSEDEPNPKGVLLFFVKFLVYTLALYYVYQPLSLIFLAPLFSILSENVQDCLNNRTTTFSISQFWVDVKRGIKIGLKNVLIQVPILSLLFFVGVFVPLLSPFTLFFSLLVTSYFYGFTMVDYRNEYYRLNPKESRAYVSSHFMKSITVGAVLNFLLYLPVLGTIFGPSYALVAAALSFDSVDKDLSKLK